MIRPTARRLGRGLVAALAAAGCSTNAADTIVMQTGIPSGRASASLSLAKERGDHLDVVMESGGFRYRFFLPNDEACRSVASGEQAVTYSNVGSFGQLQAGEVSCDPTGILSLAEWRDRGPRRRISTVIPRSRAELRQVVYTDEDLTLIRGRFLLAREVGFPPGRQAALHDDQRERALPGPRVRAGARQSLIHRARDLARRTAPSA
jgi:hypothetical protein